MRLGSLVKIRMGVTFRGREATRPAPSGSCRLVRIGDISQNGTWLNSDFARIEPGISPKDNVFLRVGDVLFPNRGNRTTAITWKSDEQRTIAGAQFFILHPSESHLLPEYLAWFLRTDVAARHFDERRKGTYVQIIQRKDIEELELPVPPLSVQQKIVELSKLAVEEQDILGRLASLKLQLSSRLMLKAADKFLSEKQLEFK